MEDITAIIKVYKPIYITGVASPCICVSYCIPHSYPFVEDKYVFIEIQWVILNSVQL